jgi:hypothetical protein
MAYKLDPAAERLIGTHRLISAEPSAPQITVTITRDLVIKARTLGWTGKQLFAEAIRLSVPDSVDITVGGTVPPRHN